jgi:hypothetical protein
MSGTRAVVCVVDPTFRFEIVNVYPHPRCFWQRVRDRNKIKGMHDFVNFEECATH